MDLFNRVIAAHAQPKKGFAQLNDFSTERREELPWWKRQAEIRLQENRVNLLGSQRFILSNQMLDHAISASLSKPDTMLDMLSTAIPCFDNMWMEFDQHHLMKKTMELQDGMSIGDLPDGHELKDFDQWPDRIGFHFRKMNDSEYSTVAYERGNIETFNQPGFGDHSFMIMGYSSGNNGETRGVSISADKIDVSPMALAIDFSQAGIHSASKDFNVNLLGETYCKTHEQQKESLDAFAGSFAISISAIDTVTNKPPIDKLLRENQLPKTGILLYGAQFFGSVIRTLISALALLNYPHIIIQRDQPKRSSRDLYLGRKLPKNELKVLEIDLPKPRGTTQYEKIFKGLGNRQRQHTRRGHWRVLKMKCGGIKRTWVRECTAGDPSLGVIIHDYHLKSKANVNSTKDYKSVV